MYLNSAEYKELKSMVAIFAALLRKWHKTALMLIQIKILKKRSI